MELQIDVGGATYQNRHASSPILAPSRFLEVKWKEKWEMLLSDGAALNLCLHVELLKERNHHYQ